MRKLKISSGTESRNQDHRQQDQSSGARSKAYVDLNTASSQFIAVVQENEAHNFGRQGLELASLGLRPPGTAESKQPVCETDTVRGEEGLHEPQIADDGAGPDDTTGVFVVPSGKAASKELILSEKP